jgi:hypothetical protein
VDAEAVLTTASGFEWFGGERLAEVKPIALRFCETFWIDYRLLYRKKTKKERNRRYADVFGGSSEKRKVK